MRSRDVRENTVRSQGEIEAAICEGISRFEQEYMGRGPKAIHAHLLGDLLVVRLHGVLTAAEKQLVKSLPAEKGRDLVKQVRASGVSIVWIEHIVHALIAAVDRLVVLHAGALRRHRRRKSRLKSARMTSTHSSGI